MNWEIFSPIGYASIALWLCIPMLWLLQAWRRKGWLIHLALVLGVVAFVLAKINSNSYVNRIQVDRSDEIEDQMARQELARQAAKQAREGEVAPIRFAEDSRGDFLDTAGMDEADLKYLQSFDEDATPDWKKEKKQRTEDAVDDSLESQVGATEETEGVETTLVSEGESLDPILMSDKDKTMADRLDTLNLKVIRWLVGLTFVGIFIDYLRRANDYDAAYFPLPLPSRWVDGMTPRESLVTRSKTPRRTLVEELGVFTRRGESFVLLTDDSETAAKACTTLHKLPFGFSPVEVLDVAKYNGKMDDDFVFETLWYGRNSFVIDSPDRAERLLARFVELLADRRRTRAKVQQAVHVVWDLETSISEETLRQFAGLGKAAGYTLLLCRESDPADLRREA